MGPTRGEWVSARTCGAVPGVRGGPWRLGALAIDVAPSATVDPSWSTWARVVQISCTTRPSTGSELWPTQATNTLRALRSACSMRALDFGMIIWSRSDQMATNRVRHPGEGAASSVMMSEPGRICRATGCGTRFAGAVPWCGVPRVTRVWTRESPPIRWTK